MDSILILTPVKDASAYLEDYFAGLGRLTYPADRISLALLESDSTDGTYEALHRLATERGSRFRNVRLFKRDFGYRLPDRTPRWDPALQRDRRAVLARSRNHLLMRALDDHDWVLWLDVDVIWYPPALIETLTGLGLDIVHPDCVQAVDGPSFDANAWKDNGRYHMQDLRGSGGPVAIDSVGGTVLQVRGDVHRDGLVFPCWPYGLESPVIRRRHPVWSRGEMETEGLAAMAHDMGVRCWGLPDLQVVHR